MWGLVGVLLMVSGALFWVVWASAPSVTVATISSDGYVNATEDDSAVAVTAIVSGDTTSTSFSITDGTDTLAAKTGLASVAFREKLHTSVGGNTLRTGGEFGSGVSRDGDILAIGVPADDANRKGAVYIVTDHNSDGDFTDSGTTVRKVNDSVAGITLSNYDNFGRSVYLSGDTLVVGATGYSSYRGKVYIITDTDSDNDWTDGAAGAVQVIASGAPSGMTLSTADYFGSSVYLRDDLLFVGANGDDTGGSERGTVYVITDHDDDGVFNDSGTTVSEINNGHSGITLTDSDYFGSSLALYGGVLAVGTPNDDSGGTDRGAVFLLTDHDDDDSWTDSGTTVTKIHTTLRDGTGTHTIANGSKIGGSLALFGNRLFIGARAASSNQGEVYLLADTDNDQDWTDSGTTLTHLHNLTGIYTLDSGDQYGSSLHAGPDSIIIGAMHDDDGVSNAGAVYVYDHSAVTDITTGQFEKDGTPTNGDGKLAEGVVTVTATAVDGDLNSSTGIRTFFYDPTAPTMTISPVSGGYIDATEDDTDIAIGMTTGDGIDTISLSFSDGTDTITKTLEREFSYAEQLSSSTMTAISLANNDFFGYGVAQYQDVLAVGAAGDDFGGVNRGVVYIIQDEDGDGDFTDADSDDIVTIKHGTGGINLANHSYFGFSVALHDGILAVGVYNDDTGGIDRGSVYLISDGGNGWADIVSDDVTKISTSTNGVSLADSDYFGSSVALSDGLLVVGAIGDDTGGTDRGAVYLIKDGGNDWADIVSSDVTVIDDSETALALADYNDFGIGVAVHNGMLAVGVAKDSVGGTDRGAVYLIDDGDNGWADIVSGDVTKISGSTNGISLVSSDKFGTSVALGDDLLAVGAIGEGATVGAVYLIGGGDNNWEDIVASDVTKIDSNTQGITLESNDNFGADVSLNNDSLAVGAWGDDTGGTDRGTVYMFDPLFNATLASSDLEKDGTPTDGDSKLAEGSITITATATDFAGNTTTDTETVAYDPTVPTANHSLITTGAVTSGSNTYLNTGDTITMRLGFTESIVTAPVVQFKNGTDNFGSAITASSVTNPMTVVYSNTDSSGDSGSQTDPLDFGNPSVDNGIVRETLGSGYVYKTTQAFDSLYIGVSGDFPLGAAFRGRTHSEKPTTTTVESAGTEMWNADSHGADNTTYGGKLLTNVASGTYFWFYPSAARTMTDRDIIFVSGMMSDDVVYYDSGSQVSSDAGSTTDPFDFGPVTAVDGVEREVLGSGYVYKTTESFHQLYVATKGTFSAAGNYHARYAPSAPTVDTLTTHGTEIWNRTVAVVNHTVSGAILPTDLPVGTYFWFYPSTSMSVSSRDLELKGINTLDVYPYDAVHTVVSGDAVAVGDLRYDITNEASVTDAAGNALSSFPVTTIPNHALDGVVPTLQFAGKSLTGTTLTAVVSENVWAGTSPTTADFSITGGGSPSINSVSGIPSTRAAADNLFTLTTASSPGADAVLSYTQNSGRVVADVASNELASDSSVSILSTGLTVSPISDGYVNDAEDESAISVSGFASTLADGTSVSVAFDGTGTDVTKTATVSSYAWSTSITSAEMKALASDGDTITVTATADVHSATGSFVYDTTAPTISFSSYAGSGILVALSEDVWASPAPTAADFSITGGGSPNVSAVVGIATTSATADRSFSLDLSAALTGSAVLAYTKNSGRAVKDVAGNELASDSSVSVTAATLTLSAISGGYVNDTEDESAITVSGTSSGFLDGTSVSVAFDGTGADVTKTATLSSNTWSTSITSAQMKALASDGDTVTVTATVGSLTATQTFVYDVSVPIASHSASTIGAVSDGIDSYLRAGDTVSVRVDFDESVAVAPIVQIQNDGTNVGSAITASVLSSYSTGEMTTTTSQTKNADDAVLWDAYSSAGNIETKPASFTGTLIETQGAFATLRFKVAIPSQGHVQTLYYKDGSDPTSRTDGTSVTIPVWWTGNTFNTDITLNDVPAGRRYWWGNSGNNITIGSRSLWIWGTYPANAYLATYTVGSSDNVSVGDLEYDITNESSVTDAAGNPLATVSATTIDNTALDTTPPTITSLSAPGTTLTVILSEKAYATTAPDIADFTISGVTLSALTGLQTTVTDSDDSFTMTLSSALSGSPTLAYTQNSADSKRIKDVAGNAMVSASSVSVSLQSMNAPTGLDLAATDDSGSSNSDNVTNNTTGLTIAGCAKADSTVTLYRNWTPISGTVTANGSACTNGADTNGKQFTKDIALAGRATPYSITAKATSGGLISADSDILSVTIDTAAPTTSYMISDIGDVLSGVVRYLNASDTLSLRMMFNEAVTTAPTVQFKDDGTNIGSAVTATSLAGTYDSGSVTTSVSHTKSGTGAIFWNPYSSPGNVETKLASFGGTLLETKGDFATLRLRTTIPAEGNTQNLYYKDGSDPTSRTDGTEVTQTVSWWDHTFYGDATLNDVPSGRRFWWGSSNTDDITIGSRSLRISGTYPANSYRATYTVGSTDNVASGDLEYDITSEASVTDVANNPMAAHPATMIANYALDTTKPTISSGSYGGTNVALVMSEKVFAETRPTPADFKIKNGSSAVVVQDVDISSSPDSASTHIGLRVPSTTWSGTVKVYYTKGTYAVEDVAGNELAAVAEASAITLTAASKSLAVDSISGGYVNATEDDSTLSISGTSIGLTTGTTVTVTVDDSDPDNTADVTKTVTTDSSGNWSTSLTTAQVQGLEEGVVVVGAAATDALSGIRSFVYDITTPVVEADATAYYGEAAFTNELTGARRSGQEIYTKVVFNEAIAETVADDSTARPELFYRIGDTETQYDIISSGTPASGDCVASGTGADDGRQYTCRYTVQSGDAYSFGLRVGTGVMDKAGNAIVGVYDHATTLSLDTAVPTATYSITNTDGLVVGSTTYIGADDAVSVVTDLSEVVETAPIVQFKNDTTNLGSAITATVDSSPLLWHNTPTGSFAGTTQVPFGFGSVSGGGLVRESLGSGYVYKTTRGFQYLRVQAKGTLSAATVFNVRYALTKPTTTNLTTHGISLWRTVSGTAVFGDGVVRDVPRNAYVWFYPSASATLSNRVVRFLGAQDSSKAVHYDSGVQGGSSVGYRRIAFDLGVPPADTGVVRQTVSGGGYAYRTTQAFDKLRVAVSGNFPINHKNLFARTASSPQTGGSDGNTNSHGTQIFSSDVVAGTNYGSGTYTFTDIPANTYFWFYINSGVNRTMTNRVFVLEGTLAGGTVSDQYTATYTASASDSVAAGDLKYDLTNEASVTDGAGNALAAKAVTTIANYAISGARPTISSVSAAGTTLTVTMSENVWAGTTPDRTDFSFSDSSVQVSSITGLPTTVATADSSFTIVTTEVPSFGSTLSYTRNSVNDKRIQNGVGSTLASVIGITISGLINVPTGLDLAAEDDAGISSTDNLTKNTSALTITGCAKADGTVTLYKDGTAISGTVTADGASCTNGSDTTAKTFTKDIDLAGRINPYAITASVTSGSSISPYASSLAITVDATAPITTYSSYMVGGLSDGTNTFLNVGDTVSITAAFDKMMGTTAPTMQLKNDSVDIGSAVTAGENPFVIYTNVDASGDSAGTSDPLDFGSPVGDIGLVREALGSGYVYKVTQAFDSLYISVSGTTDSGVALAGRMHSAKPTTGTVTTAGTQVFNVGSRGAHNTLYGGKRLTNVAAGTYFWFHPTASRTISNREITVVTSVGANEAITFSSGVQSATDSASNTDPIDFGAVSDARCYSGSTWLRLCLQNNPCVSPPLYRY